MTTAPRPGRDERGATIVEFALLMPFLLLLFVGTAEMGLGWVANDRVEGASAQAGRVAAVSGGRAEADRDVLVALAAALPADELARLDRVVVFKAGIGGAVPAGCIKAPGDLSEAGVTGACNSYTGATARGASAASMTGFGGGPTSKDRYWAPTARLDSLGDPPDYVGVWLRTTHVSEVGGLFGSLTIVKTTVFRIQPDLAG